MNICQYTNAQSFLEAAGPWLVASEAENNLILGLTSELVGDSHRFGPEDPFLATVEQEGRLVAAALRTPPRSLILTQSPRAGLETLARYLLEAGTRLPGVNGPSEESRVFAEYWATVAGVSARPGMEMVLYRCDQVQRPEPCAGRFRAAEAAEKDLLVDWYRVFHEEIGIAGPDHEATVARRISSRQLYVWEREEVVSAVTWAGTGTEGARVCFVYTPPEHRCRGYAANCAAALTGQLLAAGKRPVCLYADLANPTSNGIYRRIGYRPVCEWQEWHFE